MIMHLKLKDSLNQMLSVVLKDFPKQVLSLKLKIFIIYNKIKNSNFVENYKNDI